MAKGKGKRVSSGGPHKMHGPKRHLFKELKPMVHKYHYNGLLNKYYDYESWCLACSARGKKNTSKQEFNQFVILPWKQKEEYFKNLRG